MACFSIFLTAIAKTNSIHTPCIGPNNIGRCTFGAADLSTKSSRWIKDMTNALCMNYHGEMAVTGNMS